MVRSTRAAANRQCGINAAGMVPQGQARAGASPALTRPRPSWCRTGRTWIPHTNYSSCRLIAAPVPETAPSAALKRRRRTTIADQKERVDNRELLSNAQAEMSGGHGPTAAKQKMVDETRACPSLARYFHPAVKTADAYSPRLAPALGQTKTPRGVGYLARSVVVSLVETLYLVGQLLLG